MIIVIPAYENRNKEFFIEWKDSVHVPPHLHEAMEIVYVTSGTLEFGVGTELYHMEEGDFAIVFPNVIHHYQAWGKGDDKAIYVLVDSSAFPEYMSELQKFCPINPVIYKKDLHIDIVNSMKALVEMKNNNGMLIRAHVQMILAHVFSEMSMYEKSSLGRDNIVYNVVEYVVKNFREEITLEKMARELGVGKYVLSRIFTNTFHCNFNKYVNGIRLNYAAAILENSNESITNLCLECGFESQRTFNRVFKERYRVTPRDYRAKKPAMEVS